MIAVRVSGLVESIGDIQTYRHSEVVIGVAHHLIIMGILPERLHYYTITMVVVDYHKWLIRERFSRQC